MYGEPMHRRETDPGRPARISRWPDRGNACRSGDSREGQRHDIRGYRRSYNRFYTGPAALLVAVLAAAPAVRALDSDRDQPMHIEADSVTIDDKTKVSRYRGAVRLSQGSIQARADEITVHSDADGPERIILTGTPASFRQRPEGKEHDAYGQARRIEHDTGREVTLFIGEARFWQGQEEFAGARIEYDAAGDRVRAEGGDGDGGGRVRIVIQPKTQLQPDPPRTPVPKAPQ